MENSESYMQPSPAITVRADAMIIDCIMLMQQSNISSVLIVSADKNEILEGIFTERDLLKHFQFIQNYENLKLSIRRIMTSPLKTIDVSDLSKAPKIMLDNGFRHLPVTLKTPEGKSFLVGIISMRDVIRRMLKGPSTEDPKDKKKSQIILFSVDSNFISLVKKVCPVESDFVTVSDYFQLDLTLSQNKKDPTKNHSVKFIVDIGDSSIEQWSQAARLINSNSSTAGIIFVYNHLEKNSSVITLLKKLNQGGNILVLSKPVNVLALSDFISSSIGEFTNLAKEKEA